MSEFKRKVNEPLRLKFNATTNEENLFVRAYLFDQDGLSLTPAFADLTHSGSGIYINNSYLMPNFSQVVAKYAVFKDAGRTIENTKFLRVSDTFELDLFDPALLVPKTYAVFAKIENKNIKTGIVSGESVFASLENASSIEGKLEGGSVSAKIQNQNAIKGVVNDD